MTQQSDDQHVKDLMNPESNERFKELFNTTFQFMGLLSPEGVLLEPNATSLALVGVTREEVVGQLFWDTPWWSHSKEEQERLKQAVEQARETGERSCFQTMHEDANGQPHYVDFSLTPIKHAGQVIMLLPEGRDITDTIQIQKELEKLKQELEEKVAQRTHDLEQQVKRTEESLIQLAAVENLSSLGALVPGIAHEVSTPFGASLTGMSHVQSQFLKLKKSFEDKTLTQSEMASFLANAQESMDVVMGSMHRAGELMTSFKTVAVDQASKRARMFVVRLYIEDTLKSLNHKLKQKKVAVSLECDEGLTVESQPGLLSQIISNLVTNAVIYAFEGSNDPSITIKVDAQDGLLTLYFSDNGCGIAESDLEKVFDPFFTTGQDRGGSGLGLNIVKNLVEVKLQGSIEVTSQLGKGTSYTIRFPTVMA